MNCPACESASVILDEFQGENICTRCGLVLSENHPSLAPEWHTEPGSEAGRAEMTTGRDITRHDMGLGSKIGMGKDLSPRSRAKMRRLRKWHRRSQAVTYQEKSLRQALIDLDKLCEDLSLPKSVKAEVSSLYRKAKVAEVTPGRNTWSVLSALIFMVLRMRQISRTEKEIAQVLKIRTETTENKALNDLRNVRKTIARELELKIPRPRPEEYLARYTTKLELPQNITRRAHEICATLPKKLKQRKAAYLLAAGAIYNAANELDFEINIREVAKVLNVGVSSLSKTSQKIREHSNPPSE